MTEAANKITENRVFKPSRREFAAVSTVAALWSGNAVAAPLSASTKPQAVRSFAAGAHGMLFRPEAGEHPGLVMFESPGSSRSANAAVAQQLASQGWAVLLVETKVTDDPAVIIRDARAHVDWLVAQPGVSAPNADPVSKMHGFTLRSFSAAAPALSLASRDERRAAATSNMLFAAPGAVLAKDKRRCDSLNVAARALYKRSA